MSDYFFMFVLYSPGGLDFQSGSYPVTFLAGQTTATVAIPITNDAIAELTEDFSAVLTIPPAASSLGVTKGAADTASITILDNDPVEVNFNPTQYTVGEGDGVVTLTLTADKTASFDYTVEVLTQDGTATGNLEYYIDFCKLPVACYGGCPLCYICICSMMKQFIKSESAHYIVY